MHIVEILSFYCFCVLRTLEIGTSGVKSVDNIDVDYSVSGT